MYECIYMYMSSRTYMYIIQLQLRLLECVVRSDKDHCLVNIYHELIMRTQSVSEREAGEGEIELHPLHLSHSHTNHTPDHKPSVPTTTTVWSHTEPKPIYLPTMNVYVLYTSFKTQHRVSKQ